VGIGFSTVQPFRVVADFPSLLIHGLSSAQCFLCGCSGLIVLDPTTMQIMYFTRVWHKLCNLHHLDAHFLVLETFFCRSSTSGPGLTRCNLSCDKPLAIVTPSISIHGAKQGNRLFTKHVGEILMAITNVTSWGKGVAIRLSFSTSTELWASTQRSRHAIENIAKHHVR
jgi:hypothetical protein